MTDLAAVTPYTTVTADQGVLIHGQGFEEVGRHVSVIGDVNGDGLADLLLSASSSGGNGGPSPPGAAYVVFGRQGGFNAASFDVTTVDGTNGFKITGGPGDTLSRMGVASGDFNGDGYADLLLSANRNSYNGHYSGGAYVIYGRETFTPTIATVGLTEADGFLLGGVLAGSNFGAAVASAGDLDGDGRDDIAISASNYGGGYASYILFGANIDNLVMPSLQANAIQGVFVMPEVTGDRAGVSLGAAGDVNGDGRDDFLIGASGRDSNSGAVYVLFGRDGVANPFASPINLADLSASGQGIRITGPAASSYFGNKVAAAGDVNGDGHDDIMVGDQNNHVYVLFGGAGFATDFTVAGLTPDKGFMLTGTGSFGYTSLSGAGDINGDGYDDMIVGAYLQSNGVTFNGAAYLIYGRADFGAGLADIQNAAGVVRIQGATSWDWMGQGVSGGGDLNGDGRPDLVAGSMFLDANGNQTAGGALVIYAPDPNGPISLTGSGANDTSSGGVGADTLSGLGGNDVLNGLDGDDLLDGGDLSDQLYGGLGADDLVGGAGGDLLYGEDGADELSGGDGADKLFGGTGADLLNGGTGNDRMEGQSDIDTLNGGTGNDYLDGGLGADVMRGGADNDIYIVNDFNDETIELAGEGYDIVRTTVNWFLADHIEALELQGGHSVNGWGNGGANNLQGNSGANALQGLGGVDTLNGNDGDDQIIGGAGNDLLRGGLGADLFWVFGDSVGGAVLETDQVYDFSTAEGDTIDLSEIDAVVGGANDAFTYAGTTFTKHAGEMTLTFAGGITTLRLDVNGDGRVDYQMKINGDVTGDWGGWVL